MRQQTTISTAGGMTVAHDKPYGPDGTAVAQPSTVTVSPAYGASGAAQLTAAGIVAMTAAVNTYIAALSATDRNTINTTLPGGLQVTVSAKLVQVPALSTGVAALGAALAAVLGTGANVTPTPA